MDLQTADMAEIATWVVGAGATVGRSVGISGEDRSAVFRSFVALTYITRQAGGR